MDSRKVIGGNIRRFRKDIEWTQEKLAVRLEYGTEYPSIRLLKKMAKLINRTFGLLP